MAIRGFELLHESGNGRMREDLGIAFGGTCSNRIADFFTVLY